MLSSANPTLPADLGPYFGDATKIWRVFIFLIEIEKAKNKSPQCERTGETPEASACQRLPL